MKEEEEVWGAGSKRREERGKGEEEGGGEVVEGGEGRSSSSSSVIPISQVKKLKLREVKEIAQDSTVNNKSQDPNLPISKTSFISPKPPSRSAHPHP